MNHCSCREFAAYLYDSSEWWMLVAMGTVRAARNEGVSSVLLFRAEKLYESSWTRLGKS